MIRLYTVFLIAWTLLISLAARADDSAIEGVGGVIKPMHSHPSVRMVAEEVRIKLPEATVQATFTLRNEGPPISVLIGFPEQGKGKRYTEFKHFRSFVDGKPIKVRRIVQQKPSDDTDDYYKYWWVKRVHFDRGQTHILVSRYTGGMYFNDAWDEGFNYTLRTGASWKGPIGQARILCDLRGLRDYSPMHFSPQGFRRKGNTVSWNLRNIKPQHDIQIRWFDGFLNIAINGEPVAKIEKYEGVPIWTSQDSEGKPPRKHGNTVWLSLQTAAKWLHANLVTDGSKTTIKRGKYWVEVIPGSARLRTAAGKRTMPRKAFMEEGHTFVSFNHLVKALGGTVAFDHYGKMRVRIKASGP